MEKLIENAVKKYVQSYFQNEGDGKTNLYEGQSVVHVDNGNLPIILLYLFLNSQKQGHPPISPSSSKEADLGTLKASMEALILDQKKQFEELLEELASNQKEGS